MTYLAQLEAMWRETASLMSDHRGKGRNRLAADLKPLLLELERQIQDHGGKRPDASGTLLGFTDRIAWGGRMSAARTIHAMIESLRVGDDYLIVSVGARGPNLDMPDGNAVATVRMGDDEATAEAKYLDDAISLARAKIIRVRQAREAERAKKKGAA